MIHRTLLLASGLVVAALLGAATPETGRSTYTIALKQLSPDKGGFGLDYKFNWNVENRAATTAPGDAGPLEGYRVSVDSSGFIAADEAKNSANAIEANVNGLYRKNIPLPAWWFRSEIAKLEGGEAQFHLGLSGTAHATQDFRTHTYGIGPTVMIFSPLPDLIRNNGIDLKLGYERLVSRKYESRTFATATDAQKDVATFRIDQGFTTPFLERGIEFSYTGHYFLRASIPPQTLPRYADFLMVRLSLFDLSGGLKNYVPAKTGRIALIYTTGKLPPLYRQGDSLGGGFFLQY